MASEPVDCSTALAPPALEMQIAYQSRHVAKQRRIKESARRVPHLWCRRGRKCRRHPKLDTRLTNKQFGGKRRNRLRKVPTEANSASRISWQCCCFNSIEPNVGRRDQDRLPALPASALIKGMQYGIQGVRLYAESCGTESGLLPGIEMCRLRFFGPGALN